MSFRTRRSGLDFFQICLLLSSCSYDPNAADAIVMKEPPVSHQAKYNKKKLPLIPVVIDPYIAKNLRPHQIEGVKFMYESVMGMRKHEGNGCILADGKDYF